MSSKSNKNESGFDTAFHALEGGVVAYECYKNPDKVAKMSPLTLAKLFMTGVEAAIVIARTLYEVGSDVVHLVKGDNCLEFAKDGKGEEGENFLNHAWNLTDESNMGAKSHEFKENGSFGYAALADLAAGVETIGSCVFEALDIIGNDGTNTLGVHLA